MFCRKNGKKTFILFKIKTKTIIFCLSLTPYCTLTSSCHLLCNANCGVIFNLNESAHQLFSIWLFHHKLAFILVKFSLCQDENARNLLAHFHLWRSRRSWSWSCLLVPPQDFLGMSGERIGLNLSNTVPMSPMTSSKSPWQLTYKPVQSSGILSLLGQ